MIDIENTLFNEVATALRANHPNISVYGEYVAEPATFPCVNMWESENMVDELHEDTSAIDNYVIVTYTVQVYTNSPTKKLDAKALVEEIDTIMTGHHFRRSLLSQVPNIDRTIYRIEVRYRGIVKRTDFQATESGDTLFQVFAR